MHDLMHIASNGQHADIAEDDRLPLWWLIRSTKMPFHEVFPILRRLGLPLSADASNGQWYSSCEAFGRLVAGLPAVTGENP